MILLETCVQTWEGFKAQLPISAQAWSKIKWEEDTFYPSLIRLVSGSWDEVIYWQLEKESKLEAESRCSALLHQKQLSVRDGNAPEPVPSCPVCCGKKEGSPCFHSSANHQALVFLHARDVEMNKSKVPGLMELTLWWGKNHKVNEQNAGYIIMLRAKG